MKLMNVSINVENDLTAKEFAANVIKNSDVMRRNLSIIRNDISQLYNNELSEEQYEELKDQFEEFLEESLIELWSRFANPLTEMIEEAIRNGVFAEFDLNGQYNDIESLEDGSFDVMVYDRSELVGKDRFDNILSDEIYELLNNGELSSAIDSTLLEELADLIFEYKYYDKFRFIEVEFSENDFTANFKLSTTANIKRYK